MTKTTTDGMGGGGPAAYQYQELKSQDEFRLLELLPAATLSDPLRCHLQATTLHKCRLFDAISYCWGEQTLQPTLHCNGQIIRLTRSLDGILRQLRRPNASRILWADGICIDQGNVEERSQQVKIMRKIFARARKTQVCLGLDYGEALSCEKSLLRIKKACGISEDQFIQCHDQNAFLTLIKQSGIRELSPVDDQLWRPLVHLFERPWFTRIWVVQEVAESTNIEVLYGSTTVDWFFIRITALWLAHGCQSPEILKKFETRGLQNAAFMATRSLQLDSPNPALELFHIGRDFQATEGVDKVFAMLNHPMGICRNSEPWYTKKPLLTSVPDWQVLITGICYAFAVINGKDLFMEATILTSAVAGLVRIGRRCISQQPENQTRHVSWASYYLRSCTVFAFVIGLAILLSNPIVGNLVGILLSGPIFWYELPMPPVYDPSFELLVGSTGKARVAFTASSLLKLEVDYNKSTEEVYRNVAKASITTSGNLQCVSYVLHEPDIQGRFSTWAPRWDCGSTQIKLLSTFSHKPFIAGMWEGRQRVVGSAKYKDIKQVPLVDFDNDGKTIKVRGFVLDTITDPVRNLEFRDNSSLRELIPMNEPLRMYEGGSRPTAAILTLTASRDAQDRRIKASDKFCACVRKYIESPEPLAGQTHADIPDNEALALWRETARKICFGRAFFRTELIGLSPATMQDGDLVCVILGAAVPFILRERDRGVYQLIGEAYVHGYMNGEVFERWGLNGTSLETFNIC